VCEECVGEGGSERIGGGSWKDRGFRFRGGGGEKKTEVSGRQRSARPPGSSCLVSTATGLAYSRRANGPRFYNRRGMFCPRVEDRIYHGAADRRTIAHVLWKSEWSRSLLP